MSELVTIARPYAAAAFKRAKETHATTEWSGYLNFLSVLFSDADVRRTLNNPKLTKQKLTGFVLDLCEGQLSSEANNFVQMLIANNRLNLLPYIALSFEELKAEDEGYKAVDVKTAFPLTTEEQKKLSKALEKKLHKKVNLAITVDKSLIGGILVRAGDKVIDGSIKGRLEQLAKIL